MKILALEFSSRQRSVAVVTSPESEVRSPKSKVQGPGSKVNLEDAETASRNLPVLNSISAISVSEVVETGRANTMKPLGTVEEALKQAGVEREQIECLAIGIGPGSYTGIRAAIALAQGWQLACDVKLLGVSSAECIAAQAQADGFKGKLAVVIDAQREEFYLADYEISANKMREISALRLMTLAGVRERAEGGAVLIGPEVTRWFPSGLLVFPRAAMLGRLALGRTDFVAGDKVEPIYLRETQFVKAPPRRVIAI